MSLKKISQLLGIGLTLTISCSKPSLDIPPIGLVEEAELANQKGVEGLLIGAYSMLDGFSSSANSGWGASGSNWIYGSICGSEAYEGSSFDDGANTDLRPLESFSPNSRNGYLGSKWATVYAGIERANSVLRVMKNAKDISEADAKRISAEAKFLRGFYHFEAIKVFNKVPYVDETVTYDNGNYFLPNDTLIWPSIENDFRYAMENLPEKMDAVGRANKWAAQAYLAKTYLFQFQNKEKLQLAKPLLEELINSGVTAGGLKYNLNERYGDNFNLSTKNSGEAVFSVQISVQDGPGSLNGNFGDILNYPINVDAPGTCCGFFQPSQYLVNHFKTDPVTHLPDLDHFNDVDVKSDTGLNSSDPFIPDTTSLDPRLDWTVGRRGIPYLDWGIHPGLDWIRDQHYGGPYSPKKNAYYKDQKEKYTQADFWTSGLSANNINLLRFSDILLWAAEVEVEIGSLEKAREYVNRVRLRAANPAGWVTYPDGTPAANYSVGLYTTAWTNPETARKAVRYERALELAMEGHRFFDLVRWNIADVEINSYLKKEQHLRSYLIGASFTKGKNECFPIPQGQIDLSVGPDGVRKLKQNPGY